MAGYTRQSIADIINGADITAPPVNAEFNQITAAFNGATGHSHDGSTGNAPKIDLTTSVSGYLPAVHGGIGGKNNFAATTNPLATDDGGNGYAPGSMWENTTTGRVFICVGNTSNAAVWRELVQVQTANKIIPEATNTVDLGEPSTRFQDLWLAGGLSAFGNGSLGGTLTVTGATALSSTLAVTGTSTFTGTVTSNAINATTVAASAGFTGALTGNVTGDLTGNVTGNVTGDLTGDVTGDITSSGTSTFNNLDATGTTTITSGDINSGAMDGTTIGASTPAAGTFTNLTANTSLTAATADINGGTVDNATIGATTPSTGAFTTISTSGQATLASADINGGSIDGATIGATSHTSGKFSTLQSTGNATLATADINGGTIDGTAIGSATASSGAFTTVSATGGITGDLTGDVTGNVTGNVTGAITGNVTGDLTGNVTSAGTSTFNNVTIDGTLNMNAGTTATITNLTTPTNANDAATKGYVDTSVADLVDAAPGTLDTLNELAAALNDDPNFSTTITNSIATKLPLAGGTMSGAIAMGGNKVTGVTDPTAAQDAATKAYVDQQDGLQVTKSGDSMSGNLAMGSNNITGLATPTANDHATNKSYVDGILGSATAAAASASAAATSASNAATSETNAANSATAAAGSASSAAASYDDFDDRYLGAKSTAPTVDNDGDALILGALYFNNTTNIMYVYGSGGWQAAGSSVNGTSDRNTYTATAGQTVFAATYDTGYVDVYLNGVKLVAGTDFTATNGTSITLATGAAVNDVVDIVAYGTFVLADHYTEAQSDARFVNVTGDSMTGNLGIDATPEAWSAGGGSPDFSALQLGTAAALAGTDSTSFMSLTSNAYRSSTGWKYINSDYAAWYAQDDGKHQWYTTSSGGADGAITWDEVARFDASGNFLVGKQSNGLGNEGLELSNTGYIGASISNDVAAYFNRRGNAGDVVSIMDDQVQVGALTTGSGGYMAIKGGNNTFGSGLLFTNLSIKPTHATGVLSDGAVDLGDTNGRFKDLYLAGKLSIDAPSGNTSNVIKASANNTRATLEITGKTSAGTSVRGIVGSYGDASKVDIGTLSGHATSFLTNNQERARIDTDGRLLVGKTGSSHSIAGGAMFEDGRVYSTVDNQFTFTANRLNSDGEIIRIQKNTSTVGSIVVFDSDNVGFLSGVNNHGGIICGTASIVPALSGTYSNGATDIGTGTSKWRDIYLSGGIQFDSRSSKLDDYEEGTFNPSDNNIGNYTDAYGRYTKIGDVVNCFGYFVVPSNSNANIADIYMPFTIGYYAQTHSIGTVLTNEVGNYYLKTSGSTTMAIVDQDESQQSLSDFSTKTVRFNVTFHVA